MLTYDTASLTPTSPLEPPSQIQTNFFRDVLSAAVSQQVDLEGILFRTQPRKKRPIEAAGENFFRNRRNPEPPGPEDVVAFPEAWGKNPPMFLQLYICHY